MNLDAIPLFSMLKGRLGYLGDRQKVLAENIANASTPGFEPSDMKPFAFHAAAAAAGQAARMPAGVLAQTQAGHMPTPKRQARQMISSEKSDSEVTLDGNGVVLEEQMIKMTEARVDYDAAIGFYQKSMGLLRMAARAPGK
jgi:flagellar basal-body rod protein FlgB